MASRLDQPAASNVSNEVIAQFAIEAGAAQREIDEATGRKRAILKRAKSSGVSTKTLLSVLAMKRQDSDVVLQEQRELIRYAGIIAPHLPMSQEDLFAGLDQRQLSDKAGQQIANWDQDERGYNAGLNGGSMDDCPWAPGSPAYVAFHAGFTRGQRVLAELSGDDVKPASTARAKNRSGKDKAAGAEVDDRQTDLEQAVAATAH